MRLGAASITRRSVWMSRHAPPSTAITVDPSRSESDRALLLQPPVGERRELVSWTVRPGGHPELHRKTEGNSQSLVNARHLVSRQTADARFQAALVN